MENHHFQYEIHLQSGSIFQPAMLVYRSVDGVISPYLAHLRFGPTLKDDETCKLGAPPRPTMPVDRGWRFWLGALHQNERIIVFFPWFLGVHYWHLYVKYSWITLVRSLWTDQDFMLHVPHVDFWLNRCSTLLNFWPSGCCCLKIQFHIFPAPFQERLRWISRCLFPMCFWQTNEVFMRALKIN